MVCQILSKAISGISIYYIGMYLKKQKMYKGILIFLFMRIVHVKIYLPAANRNHVHYYYY